MGASKTMHSSAHMHACVHLCKCRRAGMCVCACVCVCVCVCAHTCTTRASLQGPDDDPAQEAPQTRSQRQQQVSGQILLCTFPKTSAHMHLGTRKYCAYAPGHQEVLRPRLQRRELVGGQFRQQPPLLLDAALGALALVCGLVLGR